MRTLNQVSSWLSELLQITPPLAGKSSNSTRRNLHRTRIAIALSVIFLSALGVRVLHWQDRHGRSGLENLSNSYLHQADQILNGEGILFPNSVGPGSAQMLVHPPGYPIFAAAILGVFGRSGSTLVTAQIVADSVVAVLVALIAAELFPLAIGVLAGLLVALSPHLSHYSLFPLPDSLTALPLLIAVYFVIRASKRPRLANVIAAGFFIGLSCWLRSNALLLPFLVAVAIPLVFESGSRLRYSLALLAAAIITISPITIRNWVVFRHFIPLSLGAGITMIEGIGDYDTENRFGMPALDDGITIKDVEWHNQPDYAGGLWEPDGIMRDRYRFNRGLDVIRSSPFWFAGVMLRRAAFMASYNTEGHRGWPFNTANVPTISAEPGFRHGLTIDAGSRPVWECSPQRLKTHGERIDSNAETELSEDGHTLTIAGDSSPYDDQIASELIPVKKGGDYILRLSARLAQGKAAAKVTSSDKKIALASEPIVELDEPEPSSLNEDRATSSTHNPSEMSEPRGSPVLEMPFASGDRTGVLLVISNNGESSERSMSRIGLAQLYEIGETPNQWTRAVRPAIRTIQRRLYITSRMLPLVLVGVVLVCTAQRWRALLLLLIVPLYYLCVQSAFHTEYRYILPIHYFLFVTAAVTLYCCGKLIEQSIHKGIRALRPN